MADTAAYGECWLVCISLSGRICSTSKPASPSHADRIGRSAISPMPQLARLGAENSGSSNPACRPVASRCDEGTAQPASDRDHFFWRVGSFWNIAATPLLISASSLSGAVSSGVSIRRRRSRRRLAGSSSATMRVPTEVLRPDALGIGSGFQVHVGPGDGEVGHEHVARARRGLRHAQASELAIDRRDDCGIGRRDGRRLPRRPRVRLERGEVDPFLRLDRHAVFRHRRLARKGRHESPTQHAAGYEAFH